MFLCLAEKAKLRRTNSRTNCQQNKITVCRVGEQSLKLRRQLPIFEEVLSLDCAFVVAKTKSLFNVLNSVLFIKVLKGPL